jgi:hypothetical protein
MFISQFLKLIKLLIFADCRTDFLERKFQKIDSGNTCERILNRKNISGLFEAQEQAIK